MDLVDDRHFDEGGEPVMDLDMESDRGFFTETSIEKDCRQKESFLSPVYDSDEYHYSKDKSRKSRLVNKSRHGDFRLEPVDEKEYCNEKSHSPAFDLGEGNDTRVRKIKIKFIKKVGHESSHEAEQSQKRKNENRGSGEVRKRKKEMDNEGGKENKSVGDESSDEAEQSLKRKSEDRASSEARKRKREMDNEGGKENKSVGDESSDEAEQSVKRKSEARTSGEARKRKKAMDNEGSREKKSKSKSESVNKIKRLVNSGDNFKNSKSNRNDIEMDEMWDTIAGDSEDDQAGQRTIEDDAFIDDTGVDPHDRILTDDSFVHNAPQAEEGEEDAKIKSKKKKKKGLERSPEETAMIIEQFLAKFEVAAEEDAEFNRQSRPAVNKLKMLPLLTEALSKKQLQQEFLDRGILSVLKNWLEPLPDGSLPNRNIRTAILKILTDLPVKIEQFDRRELLKKSGIGKSIMFLSKSNEEIPSNKKLAKDLVDKWIRPIFQKSTRYEDMRDFGEERVPYRRPPPSRITEEKAMALRFEDDSDGFDFLGLPQKPKPGEKGYKAHAVASRPEASRLDYVVRPQSKIDPEEIGARTKQRKQSERWIKLDKKLKNLKAPKKKRLQAAKINVEGRGLVKYF
ncbi:protein IWS1 homolog 1 isoform X1 [Cryptomeria japonica]|uniref:protein IWS1 homolog 1 isoform X1 n=2 Tax=Cryptomeria japonica TaxID=3369 RepID=UPI0027DA2813|nr:protein IWS1 homolog 1 isoform X1 [Cryptomeria japonica]XP_059063491.1 protein IWS1 homolog 1 isoform X1 [Cryptomeria japonica]